MAMKTKTPRTAKERKTPKADNLESLNKQTQLENDIAKYRPDRKRRFVTVIRAEKHWVEKARRDPAFFIHYVSGLEPADHHKMWLANIFSPNVRFLNIIAPRNSAKTTIVTYAMAWMIGRAPLTTNAVVSVASDQAQKRTDMMRNLIDVNDRYRNVFPHIFIDKSRSNTKSEFSVFSREGGMSYTTWRTIVSRKGSLKDPTIRSAGRGGKVMIGSRISGILMLDDIIDENDLSDEAQVGVHTYFTQTLLPMLQEKAKVVVIGTRWMGGDFPGLLSENPNWKTISTPAIKRINGEPRSYWPSEWPLERLERVRNEMGNDALFNVMYMNDPSAMSGNLFDVKSLRRGLPSPLPAFKDIYITTDFAMSLKNRADWTVYHAVAVDNARNFYVLDTVRIKTTPDNQGKVLSEFANRIYHTYGPVTEIVTENVGFQSAVATVIKQERPDLRIIPHTPKGDKNHRASITSQLLSSNKLFFNTKAKEYPVIEAEHLDFPLAKHDDTVDALSLLLQYLSNNVSVARYRVINPFSRLNKNEKQKNTRL